MKNFIKETNKMKKMKTGEIAQIIEAYQDNMIDWFIKMGHRQKSKNTVKDLYDRMKNEKFPKALNKIIKNGKKDDGPGLNIGFVVIIANFIERNTNNDDVDQDLIDSYCDIINDVLKKRSKAIAKKTDINEEIIRELLLITPDIGYISDDKFVGIYSQKMLRKLYYCVGQNKETNLTNINQVKNLFKALFGKKLLDLIAINILLEKKEYMKNFNEKQIEMWNLMTAFALDFINSEDKNHIYELIEYYCVRRRTDANKNFDAARRINKTMVTEETYPRFAKAIAKFEKKGKSSLVNFL